MKMSVDENEPKRETKTCSVCGDQALGYNFNAVTCESCKAFFRRNAMKDKELRCPFKGSCEITSLTRRFCQKCRLDKCLQVGMKRELIMSEEDKERKRRRKNDNLPNQDQLVSSSLAKASCDVSCQTEFPPCRCPCSLLGCQLLPPNHSGSPNGDREMQSTPLSSEDKMILGELVASTKDLDAPLNQEMDNIPGIGEEFKKFGSESLIDVINLTSIAIRRLIKMCKRVWGFRSLPQSDQLALLKQGCTQMMLLRSVINFDPEKDVWKIPLSENELSRIKVDVLKYGETSQSDIVQVYRSWLRGFDPRASHDLRVICILTAIALFDPNRSHLLNRDTIQLTQERYFEILRRYLESLYRLSEAHEIYANLISKMSELAGINELYVRVYLNVDPSHVEPLLIEIFDLKSC